MVRSWQYAMDIAIPLVETTPRAEVRGSGLIFPDAADESAPSGLEATSLPVAT